MFLKSLNSRSKYKQALWYWALDLGNFPVEHISWRLSSDINLFIEGLTFVSNLRWQTTFTFKSVLYHNARFSVCSVLSLDVKLSKHYTFNAFWYYSHNSYLHLSLFVIVFRFTSGVSPEKHLHYPDYFFWKRCTIFLLFQRWQVYSHRLWSLALQAMTPTSCQICLNPAALKMSILRCSIATFVSIPTHRTRSYLTILDHAIHIHRSRSLKQRPAVLSNSQRSSAVPFLGRSQYGRCNRRFCNTNGRFSIWSVNCVTGLNLRKSAEVLQMFYW